VGEGHEEAEGYLVVALVGSGAAGKGLAGVSSSSGEVRAVGGGGPARERLHGRAGELQQVEGDPFRTSVSGGGGAERRLGVSSGAVAKEREGSVGRQAGWAGSLGMARAAPAAEARPVEGSMPRGMGRTAMGSGDRTWGAGVGRESGPGREGGMRPWCSPGHWLGSLPAAGMPCWVAAQHYHGR
jgi:hypothetical protein